MKNLSHQKRARARAKLSHKKLNPPMNSLYIRQNKSHQKKVASSRQKKVARSRQKKLARSQQKKVARSHQKKVSRRHNLYRKRKSHKYRRSRKVNTKALKKVIKVKIQTKKNQFPATWEHQLG